MPPPKAGKGYVLLAALSFVALTWVGITSWRAPRGAPEKQQRTLHSFAPPAETGGALHGTSGLEPREQLAYDVRRSRPVSDPAVREQVERAAREHFASRELTATGGAPSALRRATLAAQRERELPWRLPRQCKNESRDETATRLRYLASFVPAAVAQTTVYAHRNAPAEAIAVVHRELATVHEKAAEYVGLRARPAVVYVHPDAAALREHSCSGGNAVAYYDGAIHLAAGEAALRATEKGMIGFELEIRKSLMHEYVHHVLVSNDIGRPIWLQEAMAMYFAAEAYVDHSWVKRPLELSDMVESLPATATPEVERVFYPQAQGMFWFLRRLCRHREGCVHELPEALRQGRAAPETLFEWAISERARDLVPSTSAAFWNDYVARGESFSPEFSAAFARGAPE